MHRCGAFLRQAPLRRILPDLSPVFCHQRAALRPFFISGIALALYPSC
jgi:hypothetical protein